MPYVGIDKFFWASDFPHVDHPPNYMEEVRELVDGMPEEMARGILGGNNFESPRQKRFKVAQPVTGSGKNQSAILNVARFCWAGIF
jgi:hypothetical protein